MKKFFRTLLILLVLGTLAAGVVALHNAFPTETETTAKVVANSQEEILWVLVFGCCPLGICGLIFGPFLFQRRNK